VANTTNDINAMTCNLLLRMGDAWFEQGDLRQAVDIYLKIIEHYPDNQESKSAQTALLTIAQRYERDGLLRLSLDILERVGDVMPV